MVRALKQTFRRTYKKLIFDLKIVSFGFCWEFHICKISKATIRNLNSG